MGYLFRTVQELPGRKDGMTTLTRSALTSQAAAVRPYATHRIEWECSFHALPWPTLCPLPFEHLSRQPYPDVSCGSAMRAPLCVFTGLDCPPIRPTTGVRIPLGARVAFPTPLFLHPPQWQIGPPISCARREGQSQGPGFESRWGYSDFEVIILFQILKNFRIHQDFSLIIPI
jgi:hypothetical protein